MFQKIFELLRGASFYPELLFWINYLLTKAIDFIDLFDAEYFFQRFLGTLFVFKVLGTFFLPYPIMMTLLQNGSVYASYHYAIQNGTYASGGNAKKEEKVVVEEKPIQIEVKKK